MFTKSSQIILVISKDYNSSTGVLQRVERNNNSWSKVDSSIKVFLGRNGIAPADGLCKVNHTDKTIKNEGDGKSPSGVFSIGRLFGNKKELNTKMPYFQVSKNIHCVDDVTSKLYNKIVTKQDGYTSYETMLRDDGLYNLGAVVQYNSNPTIKTRGSCIFLHISADRATAGCTSMKEPKLREVLKWLDEEKKPLFIQLPEATYNGLDLGSLIK